jgi:hypothetical protein
MHDVSDFITQHGGKTEIYHENLKFQYQKKPLRYYTASIYGLPFVDFPVTAFTSERSYQ